MKKYLGVKVVHAKTMTLGAYNEYRGWKIPENEDPARDGYLVRYPDGYESWCPKEQFEEANRPIDGLTFGHAIEAAKMGNKIARAGWNGRGIFVFMVSGSIFTRSSMPRQDPGYLAPFLAIDTIGLKTDNASAPKSIVPWLASQTDMLSEDWQIVE